MKVEKVRYFLLSDALRDLYEEDGWDYMMSEIDSYEYSLMKVERDTDVEEVIEECVGWGQCMEISREQYKEIDDLQWL